MEYLFLYSTQDGSWKRVSGEGEFLDLQAMDYDGLGIMIIELDGHLAGQFFWKGRLICVSGSRFYEIPSWGETELIQVLERELKISRQVWSELLDHLKLEEKSIEKLLQLLGLRMEEQI